MAKKEQAKLRTRVTRNTGTVVEDSRPNRERTRTAEKAAAIESEMDAILADIDDVLEVNAQEFISQYVQKGGE